MAVDVSFIADIVTVDDEPDSPALFTAVFHAELFSDGVIGWRNALDSKPTMTFRRMGVRIGADEYEFHREVALIIEPGMRIYTTEQQVRAMIEERMGVGDLHVSYDPRDARF